jgi:hypothetical protein
MGDARRSGLKEVNSPSRHYQKAPLSKAKKYESFFNLHSKSFPPKSGEFESFFKLPTLTAKRLFINGRIGLSLFLTFLSCFGIKSPDLLIRNNLTDSHQFIFRL